MKRGFRELVFLYYYHPAILKLSMMVRFVWNGNGRTWGVGRKTLKSRLIIFIVGNGRCWAEKDMSNSSSSFFGRRCGVEGDMPISLGGFYSRGRGVEEDMTVALVFL